MRQASRKCCTASMSGRGPRNSRSGWLSFTTYAARSDSEGASDRGVTLLGRRRRDQLLEKAREFFLGARLHGWLRRETRPRFGTARRRLNEPGGYRSAFSSSNSSTRYAVPGAIRVSQPSLAPRAILVRWNGGRVAFSPAGHQVSFVLCSPHRSIEKAQQLAQVMNPWEVNAPG